MKRLSVLVLMIAASLVSLSVFSAREIVAEADTGFRVEQPKLDLGDIKSGTDAVATFVFHNPGETPVRIIKAKPS